MIQELDQKKMETLKELANTNLKISEAKNVISKLQEEETEYLEAREKKAFTKINKVLSDSKDLLDQTHQNYEQIHEFCKTVTEYADFLSETHGKFQEMLQAFEKRNEIWDENVKKINQELADQKHTILQDAKAVEAKEKRIIEEKERIARDRAHLESQQATLLASYKVEKDLWTKLNKK